MRPTAPTLAALLLVLAACLGLGGCLAPLDAGAAHGEPGGWAGYGGPGGWASWPYPGHYHSRPAPVVVVAPRPMHPRSAYVPVRPPERPHHQRFQGQRPDHHRPVHLSGRPPEHPRPAARPHQRPPLAQGSHDQGRRDHRRP